MVDIFELESYAADCEECSLHNNRINPVFAKGNLNSSIFICGMVPAHEENAVGIPFVGRAGKLLDHILEQCGLDLNDVYITNIVKCCLAPGIPLKQEWVDTCLPYLVAQISELKPKVILTLGKDASDGLFGRKTSSMGSIRGKVFYYGDDIRVVPTYHPSYLLRGGGKKHKDMHKVLADFELAKSIGCEPECNEY